MASIQVQRPVTKTQNAIDQKQSLEVVQTLLHGGLSSLSYQRALFTDKVFDEQFYVTGDHVHSYADYAAAKLPQKSPRDGTTATKMQVLRRGRSRRVDQFLDWLEKGAFVALEAGKLKALQLSTLEIASLTSPATLRNEEVQFPTELRYDHPSSTHKYIDSTNGSQEVQIIGDGRDTSETATLSPPTSAPARNLHEAVMTPLQDGQTEKSGIFTESALTHELKPRNHKQPLRNRATSSSASQSTSFSALSNMKREFEGMMRSETMSQGDTQSQYFGPPQVSANKSTCSPSKLNATISPVVKSQVCLIPSKASKIARDAQRLRKHALDLAKSEGKKIKKGHIVLCQCGLKEEGGDMVQCETCQTWQHLPCYGFTGGDDPRLYDRHTCYHCLLADDKTDNLEDLQRLIQKRRVMHFIIQHGARSQTELVDDINMPVEVAGPIYQMLKSAGYFVPATGSHKAGYKKTGKPLFVAVRDGPKYEEMLKTLFDPLTLIAHHYEIPSKAAVEQMPLKQNLFATQSGDMPPPATPASKLRKQNAMTPASGLDQRASLTPFQTPIRRLPKRSFEEEATPASKRLKSVQTLGVLNANGLPSSPAGLMR
ncbi:hypothetical protein KC318_g9212 [Hortaea werneckii]|nr:hypothetical protein KC334_g5082 [Hortaea werneckii]KAI7016124.1 hypothetical protein KC355_g4102 [Hortaea werneckii]KAI7661853.1 hypothetical protein KC318_g9212 [Hortaea werneckii]